MVRDATPDDAPGIAAVHVAAWRGAYRGILPKQLLDDLSVALREGFWRGHLESEGDDGFTLVAEGSAGEAVEGFCAVALPARDEDAGDRTAEIVATYVDPPRWGSGVGRSLLDEALGRLRSSEHPWEDVLLWVFLRNAQARAFYARSGFRLDEARRKHDPSGVTVARMRRTLP